MFPSFFDENMVSTIYEPRFDLIINEAAKFKQLQENKSNKIALFIIDAQNSFTNPNGSLFVQGSVEDNINICKFIYNNITSITTCFASLDSHLPYQIFSPLWWLNTETQKHPEPFTLIFSNDIKSGKYIPLFEEEESLEYCEKLEQNGKKVLTIWPIHTMTGTIGQNLNSSVYEAILFHSIVSKNQPVFLQKGSIPNTENYSVLSPEIKKENHPNGKFNKEFFNKLVSYDKVYICGEASSHCVMETIVDIQKEMNNDKKLLNKIYILEDCMSPVSAVKDNKGNIIVDFPLIANQALIQFQKSGMNLVKSAQKI